MPAPTCQHDDGCTNEGFSQSVEHDNLWLCAKHYKKVLPTLKSRSMLQIIGSMSDDDRKELIKVLGGKPNAN